MTLVMVIRVIASDYSVTQVPVGSITEHRFFLGTHHFLTIIDDQGTFAIRPHPGVDVNGWGSTWYGQPFLPGATLKHTSVDGITSSLDGIQVAASGFVSKGANDTFGTWALSITFGYDPAVREITGQGGYQIVLDGTLSGEMEDLNLYRLASNYLDNVPLLSCVIGDTGDMQQANVTGNGLDFVWIPPDQPAHFPQDVTDQLCIEVLGQFNNVDTAGQGFEAIDPAYKPTVDICLTSHQAGIDMIFGARYDVDQAQLFYADNVGITPLILESSPLTRFDFDVEFHSEALPGDGMDLDFDGILDNVDNCPLYFNPCQDFNHADFDTDCDADVFDFLTFSNCFNGSLNPPTPICANSGSDLDGDGDVDGFDFLTFSNCFNGSLNPPGCP